MGDNLFLLAVSLLSVSAMACLCLAMNRHVFDLSKAGGRLPLPPRIFRRLGWLLVALVLLVTVARQGWSFGLVASLGCLTAGAVPVLLLASYRITRLAAVGLGSGGIALVVFAVSYV